MAILTRITDVFVGKRMNQVLLLLLAVSMVGRAKCVWAQGLPSNNNPAGYWFIPNGEDPTKSTKGKAAASSGASHALLQHNFDGSLKDTIGHRPSSIFEPLYVGSFKSKGSFKAITGGQKATYVYDKENSFPDFDLLAGGGQNNPQQGQANDIYATDIGVNYESMRANFTHFMTLEDMRAEHANSVTLRDNYLNLINTANGVAIETILFLDKGVSGGLATAFAQQNGLMGQDLQKEISNFTEAVANPEMAGMIDDKETKKQACFMKIQDGLNAQDSEHTRKYLGEIVKTLDECPEEDCGPEPTSGDDRLYEYCNCCALKARKPNKASSDKEGEIKDYNNSVWYRLMFGYNAADKQGAGGGAGGTDKAAIVRRMAATLADFYGDVRQEMGQFDKNAQYVNADREFIRYHPPTQDVTDLINLCRDGDPNAGSSTSSSSSWLGFLSWLSPGNTLVDENHGLATEPIEGMKITDGICRATIKLMSKYPNITDVKDTTLTELWVQASLGGVVGADFFKNLYDEYLRGRQLPLGDSWEPAGEIRNFLLRYCDEAAAACAERVHIQYKLIVAKAMRGNRNLTPAEKGEVNNMVSSVDEQFRLARQEIAAGERPNSMLEMLRASAARSRETTHAATVAGAQNAANVQPSASSNFGR